MSCSKGHSQESEDPSEAAIEKLSSHPWLDAQLHTKGTGRETPRSRPLVDTMLTSVSKQSVQTLTPENKMRSRQLLWGCMRLSAEVLISVSPLKKLTNQINTILSGNNLNWPESQTRAHPSLEPTSMRQTLVLSNFSKYHECRLVNIDKVPGAENMSKKFYILTIMLRFKHV